MPKKFEVAKPTDDTAMAVVVYGDAVALGEDTLTSVSTGLTISDNGSVAKAKGEIESVAVAESSTDDEFALAVNDVIMSGGDVVVIKIKNSSLDGYGESYSFSATKFIAIDMPVDLKNPIIVEIGKEILLDEADVYIEIDGNVSTVEFDVQAYGENSLAAVDAYSLAIENEMSLSTILAVAATE